MATKAKWYTPLFTCNCFFAACCHAKSADTAAAPPAVVASSIHPPAVASETVKLGNEEEHQGNNAFTVAVAAEKVVWFTASNRPEPEAAVLIQSAFRGYLARRAIRALRGLVRLKSLVGSDAAKLQTANTLKCMQTVSRVQLQILSRRIRMTEENQAFQKQMLMKHERELEKLKIEEEWNDSLQSKEQIETNQVNKQGAAIKRERALAYAFSHQWRSSSSSRSIDPTTIDPSKPQWGWSWLERWATARPWMPPGVTDNDNASLRSATTSTTVNITTRRDSSSPGAQKSIIRTPSRSHRSPSLGKTKTPTVRGSWDDDSRSMQSFQSGRRRSFGGSSSMKDDESLASSSVVSTLPSYMSPTQSAKAKSRFQTPSSDSIETPEVKKRLSFTMEDKPTGTSPARVRRHSGPPKVDIAYVNKIR